MILGSARCRCGVVEACPSARHRANDMPRLCARVRRETFLYYCMSYFSLRVPQCARSRGRAPGTVAPTLRAVYSVSREARYSPSRRFVLRTNAIETTCKRAVCVDVRAARVESTLDGAICSKTERRTSFERSELVLLRRAGLSHAREFMLKSVFGRSQTRFADCGSEGASERAACAIFY